MVPKARLSKIAKDQWKRISDDDYERYCQIQRSRVVSEETRAKIAAANVGRKHTDECKKRISKGQSKIAYQKGTSERRSKLRAAWIRRKARGKTKREIDGHARMAAARS